MENCQDVSVLDAANLKNKVDYLESQLVEYQQVVEERDFLLKEVGELKYNIQELLVNKEKLQEEHAEELAVLSSSFSQHFEDKNNDDNEEKVKEYEREIQKLRNCIEDKTYHINQLQKKLMKTQLEMENDLEKHEAELENLRSQLEKLENSDTESLVEERMNELKESYEKEIQVLKEKLQAKKALHLESIKDEQLNKSFKEIEELKLKLKNLEDGMEERMEEEETKFRREVMTVKDKLIHQHQLEIDELLSQLERSNAEVEKLRRLSRQGDSSEYIARNQPVANGNISGNNIGSFAWNGLQTENGDSDSFKLIPVQIEVQDPKMYEELDRIHAMYQQQADFMCKRMKAQFQEELEDNIRRLEDDYEQQLEKQRAEYEEKIVGVQKQLRAQHQSDLDRVTNDMEDQIQVLKNGHTEEIAEMMQRLRGLSDERRRSYIEQDNTQQHVIVIKEEFKSKVESLEQELRMERQKVADYEEKLQGVETQVRAFKNEKEQEVKYIEEELKKQCKLLVEKKAKELKEKYQSELNEKVNKVEKTLRKQYDEDSVRARSELEESHRTLKEKYENEITDIMTQMEQVQQRNQEVFEAQQKEQFEKQLSLVMEELEPYKDKCQELENENKDLLDKYNRDLSELKVKMNEVEKRYSANEKIEQESLRNLGEELNLYKTKVKELEEGNQMLVMNFGAQLENMKKKYEEGEEGELKTLQEEVTIYTKKVEKLEHENQSMSDSYESQIRTLNEQLERIRTDCEEKENAISRGQIEKEELNKIVDELSKQLESYINNCAELEETKKALDNRHAEEIEILNEKMRQLDKDLQYYRGHCNELENANKVMESEYGVAKDDMIRKSQLMESELVELRKNASNNQEKRKNSTYDFEEMEKLTERIQELEQELLQRNHDNQADQNKINPEEVQNLTQKITELEKSVEEFRHNCSELQETKTSMEEKHVVEKQELISRIEKQTVLTGERERDLQIAIQDKQQLQGDLKKAEEQLENSNNKFEVFKTEKEAVIAQQTSEINELTNELEKLNEARGNQDLNNLSEENKRLKTEHKHLEVNLDNLRAENEQLLDEIKDAADKHKKELNKLNEEVLSLREQETKQSKNLDKVQERYELLIIDLKEEIETQKGSISELEATNSKYVQEIANLLAEAERQKETKVTKTHNDSISSEESFTLKQDDVCSSQENVQKYKDEIAGLKAENEQYKGLIRELEDEGDNKFGVLLSQHEKELEVLKEELEEQIARKREQLAKEATAKRQKLKEEYEAKLRVIYDELVTERSRSKDQFQQINQLSQKVKLLEGINIKQKKDIERVKQMEDKLKEFERQSKKKDSDVESKEDDYKVNIHILEEKLEKLSNEVERTEKELKEAKEKVKSLQDELDVKIDENDKLRCQLENLPAREEAVVADVENKVESQGDDYQSKEIKTLIDKMKELEIAKAKQEKQSQEAALRIEKLQKDLQNMDKARQAVVQMYDEKIEAMGVELDDAIDRGDVLRKQLEETKKMLRLKQKEMEEKQKTFSALENELKNEKDMVVHLKEKIIELEEHLTSEKEKTRKMESEKIENEEVCEKLTMLSTDLQNEREVNSNLKEKIEKQNQEIESQDHKLDEIKGVVTKKDHVINEYENKFKAVQEELILEKEKSSNLVKELEIIKDSESSNVLQSIEQMKKELNKQHEESNEKLKESYESLLSKKEEENRVKSDELQAEIVTLKGMVENLEQLNQLKDEDKELQLKELEERQEASMREHLEVFANEKKDLERKLLEATSEEGVRSSKVDELTLQIQTLTEEEEALKKTYENEIQTLKKQLDFESSFQVELQESFQNELKTNMEKQSREHKDEIERVNAELQQKIKELEENKTEHATLQKELEVSKKTLETHILEIKNLEDRIVESKAKHEEEVLDLKSKLETLSNKEDVVENNTNDELITSLRADNKGLSEEIQRLQSEIQEKEITHQEEIAFITSELQMRFHQREDDVNRYHSQEFDSLMTRIESLVQKENDSKALTQSHMQEITSVRNEMEQRVERLARDKEREVEAARRALEDHYVGKQRDLQEQLNSKCQEVLELKQMVRTLKNKAESSQEQSTEELSRLRHENTELYRKLRETSPKHGSVISDTIEMTDTLRIENKKLQREIESLKTTMQRQTKTVGESSESIRLLQLVKVMEQLMTEKSDLEMKLRQEILDLKSRFGDLSKMGGASSNFSSTSLSPEKVSRENLLEMLQDLRASKRKQEEEIQAHIREIEKMIEDIRKKIKCTEFADHRIQEMLANQLQHLEKQRRLLVNRLVKLREKHDSVEEKLTQQIAGMSTQSSPGRDELVKSRWYQNLLEENLKKEKELLVMKRQQINDLQTRLSLEKALMERKVAERQKLKQQLSEKNKQESELSLERSELEKKWINNLKMREIELKQKTDLRSRTHLMDTQDSIAARISGLISRSSGAQDNKPKTRFSNLDYQSPITSSTVSEAQQSLNRYSLSREARADPRLSMAASVTTKETPPTYNQYRLSRYENTGPSSFSRYPSSKRTDRDEFKMLPNEVPKQMPINSLDLSSDDELDELAPSSNEDSLYWEMDIKNDYSDVASITPESTSTLDGMEKDWEKNLEEELRQISAGTLRVLPSGRFKESTTRRENASAGQPRATRNQSELSARGLSTSMSPYNRLSQRENTSRVYENYLSGESFPRSSTALPGDEHEEWLHRNGSFNVSQIPTVLPTLLNDIRIQGTSRRETETRDSVKYHATPTQEDRNPFSFTSTPMNKDRDDSPNSSKSEPTRRTSDRSKTSQTADRSSSVFLLNYDDYIDRHQVRSSDKVASLRDLSPSEKYSLC
ncbi:COP1-interactive protein 1-like [Actinia tenebrosa]|uniref:COP1-interactive protein 1-like n=1 Tax=Actinia tenebrosa TaxID=6105 RepID=A0A6P8I3X1_ACTTE|nr:COP1-interactive protein 1-like [Actinia tenebrosa]XP_031563264.1 COP1-interactive protein 1-like [Actinia tenebrosa]XP_031563265.1 COP1-interactive protein 1-like [Actinia tenebrosa]